MPPVPAKYSTSSIQWLDEHSSKSYCGIKLAKEVQKFVSQSQKSRFRYFLLQWSEGFGYATLIEHFVTSWGFSLKQKAKAEMFSALWPFDWNYVSSCMCKSDIFSRCISFPTNIFFTHRYLNTFRLFSTEFSFLTCKFFPSLFWARTVITLLHINSLFIFTASRTAEIIIKLYARKSVKVIFKIFILWICLFHT